MDTATFAPRLAARLAPAATARESADFLLALLHQLRAGQAVTPAALARALHWPAARVDKIIAQAVGMERDADGAIAGYALTLRQTPYRFEVAGRVLYTWCAFDTLFFPPLLGCRARVTSRCALSGLPIALEVTPETMHDLRPADAVISMLLPTESDDIRTGFCNQVRFFASAALAREWAAGHPQISVMPVAEVFTLARASAQWIRAAASAAAA